MNQLLKTVIDVCDERGVDVRILLWPAEYSDHVNCARRRNAIRALREKGFTTSSIVTVCPLTKRMVRMISRRP
jgi:hypothetical protein